MTSSARVKSNRLGLWFRFRDHDDFDDPKGVQVWRDVTSAELINEPTLEHDFHMHAYPARDTWAIEVSAVQSTDPQSLWMMLWDHAWEVVEFTFAPHANEEPTDEQPHFTGSVQFVGRPSLGGTAARYGSQAFNTILNVTDGPHKVPA